MGVYDMKVYKNGICREIDQKRAQEFKEKGYTIEGKTTTDTVEVLKQEKEALKAENEALKVEKEALKVEKEALKAENEALKVEKEALKVEKEALKVENEALKVENEALKAHTGGEENADTGGEIGETKATTRGKK